MKAGKILGIILIAVAFVAGLLIGKGNGSIEPPQVVSGNAGATYGAGFNAEGNEFTLSGNSKSVAGPPMTDIVVVVSDGESIQAAVQKAEPGTTIQVMPGTYHETVYIDKDGIRLIGVIQGSRRPTLDGEGKLNDAILYSGNNVVV